MRVYVRVSFLLSAGLLGGGGGGGGEGGEGGEGAESPILGQKDLVLSRETENWNIGCR